MGSLRLGRRCDWASGGRPLPSRRAAGAPRPARLADRVLVSLLGLPGLPRHAGASRLPALRPVLVLLVPFFLRRGLTEPDEGRLHCRRTEDAAGGLALLV